METLHSKMKENMKFIKEFSNQSQNSMRSNRFNMREIPMNSPMSESRVNQITGMNYL